jgi:hypothetical protein
LAHTDHAALGPRTAESPGSARRDADSRETLEPVDPWPNSAGCQVIPEWVALGRRLLGRRRRRLGFGRLTVGDCERRRQGLRHESMRQRPRAQPRGFLLCLALGVTTIALGERRAWLCLAERRRLDRPGWLGYRLRDTGGH